ncbi:unnamed protein product [Citrullus colocynthis]|uniref:Uncharacterized protein n=1 Tax=Citrullus colocynthis TaxID=252529 RepID=A0ABP0YTD6_9ROSI
MINVSTESTRRLRNSQQLPIVLCLHSQVLVERWHDRCNPSLKLLRHSAVQKLQMLVNFSLGTQYRQENLRRHLSRGLTVLNLSLMEGSRSLFRKLCGELLDTDNLFKSWILNLIRRYPNRKLPNFKYDITVDASTSMNPPVHNHIRKRSALELSILNLYSFLGTVSVSSASSASSHHITNSSSFHCPLHSHPSILSGVRIYASL